jgi:two-component system sensor histidine kinase RegB
MTLDVRTTVSEAALQGNAGMSAPKAMAAVASPRIDRADAPPLLAGLRQLWRLRSVAIVGQALAIAVALGLGVALPVVPMASIVGLLVMLNVLVSARLKRGTPATHGEMAAHLALDLAAFTALLLLAGGTANPFGLVFLLHVVLIAMLLPWRLALAGTALVIASFALAFHFAAPLRDANGMAFPDDLMALALWLAFTLTAAVTAWFIVRIVATLREHERLLREAARRALNNEAVLRIGTLAAGAAHELATPLTTMAVVVGEMRRQAITPAQQRDVAILAGQIDICGQALVNLRAAAGHAQTEGGERARLDAFLVSIVARFRAMRPDIPLEARWDGTTPAPEIFADQSLHQAILVLLNNAADASPHHVEVAAKWDRESLQLTVSDRGGGVPAGSIDKLGRTFFTTKPPGQGTGLGLVLTASTMDRLGGTVRWSIRTDGGLVAEIRLPLRGLTLAAPTR